MYVVMVLLLMIVLPVGSILADALFVGNAPLMALVGKWFVFWAAGVRLLLAGIRQATQPDFTAHEIFKMKSDEAYPVVRELGMANIATGLLGVASVWATSFVLPAAIAGAIFYGAAGVQHVLRTEKTANETLATITDILAFAVLAAYVLYVWFGGVRA